MGKKKSYIRLFESISDYYVGRTVLVEVTDRKCKVEFFNENQMFVVTADLRFRTLGGRKLVQVVRSGEDRETGVLVSPLASAIVAVAVR